MRKISFRQFKVAVRAAGKEATVCSCLEPFCLGCNQGEMITISEFERCEIAKSEAEHRAAKTPQQIVKAAIALRAIREQSERIGR